MNTRNVILLSLSQAMAMTAPAIVVLLGGIIGADLAPSPELATLPISIMILGVAAFTFPAALLMKRIGRRRGFLVAAVMASSGALMMAYAIVQQSYLLLCAGSLLIGGNGAFVQQYRFAAAESSEPRNAGKAVSYVLAGGILAGYLGPEVARRTQDWLGPEKYVGSFVALAAILGLVAVLMLFLQDVAIRHDVAAGAERSLLEVGTQPRYLTALLAGVVSYAVMSLIMTATPITMHAQHGFSLDQTALVIRSHMIAMYLPSLITGYALERLGASWAMVIGLLCMTATVFLGLVSRELVHIWAALVLLGVGWNLLFVGATVLLTSSYRPSERLKAQALNDFTIFATQAFTSFLAAAVLFHSNWAILNLLNLPFLFLTLGAILLLHRKALPVLSEA